LHEEFAQLVREYMAQLSAPTKKLQPLRADDVPVIQIVETIMKYAYQSRASDVHFEPVERDVPVRFRIDGVLGDVVTLPHDIYDLLVMRIKVMSQLRTDEHLAAQDGKLRFKTQEEEIDVRVSIVPIVHGEKIVLRLLSQKQRKLSLEDVGMQAEDLRKVREAALLPHGMILATGPTGSGKTTSLYCILKILNTRDVNISTIEDPVEYYIEGVNHIQVNTRTNLTFAQGLRALVRQDPDIIMVGEIRDAETANIAVNAALTGHLVLSSIHTNDAATTLPRLLDMEVEPFLAASSVNVAMGQRLVRRICAECRATAELSDYERETILRLLPPASKVRGEVERRPQVYKGMGCAACNNLGYIGRIGIYEVLIIDDPIRELIIRRASAAQLRDRAIEGGMTTMLEDGISKVFQGITTVEEVLRAAKE
jgi:type II secretory ATPase GspE/PulE/Tfp pilus assembly ATPase PilB-like protein